MNDLISRQAAIDALDKRFDSIPMEQTSPATDNNVGTNDVISRQAVIEMLDETRRIARQNIDGAVLMTFERVFDSLVNITNALPPIQPKRGRWIKLDMHRGMADHKCTACKQECYVPTCMGEPMYAYCPNCGADMRERKERTVRAIDADALQRAIVEEGQANKRKKYVIGDIWELTGAEIRDVINSQPTIQPEPHWIPVTERLPEINEDILLSYFDEVTIGWLNSDGSWSIFDGQECVSADEISAWMPLPEPYKGVTT